MFNVLEGDERSALRAALTVNLRCRVLPKIDPEANLKNYFKKL